MFSDSHIHTRFSGDCDTEPEEIIKKAIEIGLPGICFTDHEDKGFVIDGIEYVVDWDSYFPTLLPLKEKYKDKIDIRIGVEYGLAPHLGEYGKMLTAREPFDFVIGSVHQIDGKDPYYPEFFENRTDEEVYSHTFDLTIRNIEICKDCFDVLGHLDYVTRYGKEKDAHYSYERYKEQIDTILKLLIENGKGLEINTAGLKYGLPYAHPHPDVLKRYREMGGEIITVGADSHKLEYLGYKFDEVREILLDAGFAYYTEFVERKPRFVKII